MGTEMHLAGKRVLVLGLGETGLSIARWAARSGGTVRVADTRADPPTRDVLRATLPAAEVITGAFTDRLLDGIDLVAASPGVPLSLPLVRAARAYGLQVVGDVELFARFIARAAPARILAITGTNGKSTVTALTGALCRAAGVDAAVAGNISPAVLTALLERLDRGRLPDVWVLELSSFQLEATTSLVPDAATVLNVTPDHLDRYPGMADYAAAKARIFTGDGTQVLNRDDSVSMGMRRPGRKVSTFGVATPPADDEQFGLVQRSGEYWLAQGSQPLLALRDMQLAGLHNAANALAALALARAIELPQAPLLDALRSFRGLPHRVERVAEIDGVVFYDDSKGTNVGSTVAALAGLAPQLNGGGKVVLIAGGDGKQQDFTPLAAAVGRTARAVVLIGRDAPLIAAAVSGSGARIERADSMTAAVACALRAAAPGDAVLLSPACASFDMFANYRHRGEVFCAAVKELERARAD